MAGKFSWRPNPLGGIDGDDDFDHFTGQLDPAKYLEVTVAPEDQYLLSLGSISFTTRRSSTGVRSYAVRSSLDGFAANLPAVIWNSNPNLAVAADNSFQWLFDSVFSDQIGSRVELGSAFSGLSGAVTFRFYGWNAESALGGNFGIDDVCLNGSVELVPEPQGGRLFGILAAFWGGSLLLAGRRTRWEQTTFVPGSRCPERSGPV